MTIARRGEAWEGDWPARLASELTRHGVSSLLAFADRRGLATYAQIASALDGTFAPAQMMMTIRDEFVAMDDLKGFVADCLYRYLTECVKAPISSRASREFQVAHAIGACSNAIGSANNASIVEVGRRLMEHVLQGWLPAGRSDGILLDALGTTYWQLPQETDRN